MRVVGESASLAPVLFLFSRKVIGFNGFAFKAIKDSAKDLESANALNGSVVGVGTYPSPMGASEEKKGFLIKIGLVEESS